VLIDLDVDLEMAAKTGAERHDKEPSDMILRTERKLYRLKQLGTTISDLEANTSS
jgi:hypothetical protein